MELTIGLKHMSVLRVGKELTALAMGSGDMPVMATPAMLALMENAAMLAVQDAVGEGMTTVGGYIESSHVKPSRLGDKIWATATLVDIDGRKLHFRVVAHDEEGNLMGEGTHLRFIVNREKFLSRL